MQMLHKLPEPKRMFMDSCKNVLKLKRLSFVTYDAEKQQIHPLKKLESEQL